MRKFLKELITDKKILILGFGREGRSTLKLLLETGTYKSLTVSDVKDVSGDLNANIGCIYGVDYMATLNDYDVVFKSPGIVLEKDISEYTCLFTSQTEIFIQAYREQIIGVTGTKGKSTTSSFIYHVLKECGKKVLFAGNIGIPVFDIADSVEPDSIIVIELSCHQLEYAKTSPHRAILLNIFEDHLDHYITRERYGLAKKNIYKFQREDDILFTSNEVISEWGDTNSRLITVDKNESPVSSFESIQGAMLRGGHNLLNISFAYLCLKDYGISDEQFVKAVATFKTLSHRLEFVGNIDGVDYYDDSISTTVMSAISAVESINNASVLLVGGMERNIDYSKLVEYVSHSKLKYLICMYESGLRISKLYSECYKEDFSPKAVYVSDLQEAVAKAKELAKPKEAVLLSPAAASYGYFKNFEERGNMFKDYVKKR